MHSDVTIGDSMSIVLLGIDGLRTTSACHLRSRAFYADDVRSGFEYCFQDFDRQPNMEKASTEMFFGLALLVFRVRDLEYQFTSF